MAYVYGHYKADTGELFYIGKGIGKRAWSKTKRNPHWKAIVNKHGYTVKILHDNLTEEDAYGREKELIAEVGLEKLTNLREGGNNPTSADVKRLWKDPAYREHLTQVLRIRNQTLPTNSEWLHNVTVGNQNRPDSFRKNVSDAIKEKYETDPTYKNKVIEANKKLSKDPEWRRKNKEVAKQNSTSIEFKQACSDAAKLRWQDPTYREKMLLIRRARAESEKEVAAT